MSDNKFDQQQLMMILDLILSSQRKIEEYMQTILHAVCKSDDEKTIKAIKTYLSSDFRNDRSIL